MSAVWAMNQLEQLKEQLASAQATCSKLHDLNHMQAQQIEVLKAQCIALCGANKKAGEYWHKKYAELEQELLASYDDNRSLRSENTRLVKEHVL